VRSIYPSEQPQWGWLVPCLDCSDLGATLEFYEKLGFVRIGGEPENGWAIIHSGPFELHLFSSMGPGDLLNFRGGDVEGIRAAFAEHGLSPIGEDGPTSFTYTDPDGGRVFFDIGEPEISQLQSGQPLTIPLPDGVEPDQRALDLGNFSWCLTCEDLQATIDFYGAMGFPMVGGDPAHGWAILARIDHPPDPGRRLGALHLSLFSGMGPMDMLNFRGANVTVIADALSARGIQLGDGVTIGGDGGESLRIKDPDDRTVFFDTTPPERLYGQAAG
jgi:catechol 2,3-dioxygenase-like lactoylglutathione lyase family enzyme